MRKVHCWRPLGSCPRPKDAETHFAAVIEVWVELHSPAACCHQSDTRRFKRIVLWAPQNEIEKPTLVRSTMRSNYQGVQLGNILLIWNQGDARGLTCGESLYIIFYSRDTARSYHLILCDLQVFFSTCL